MWGGWYSDPLLMDELKKMHHIYSTKSSCVNSLGAEVVLFADEDAYDGIFDDSPQLAAINETRIAMGNTGVPYDLFMVEDASDVIQKYKAAVFLMPVPSKEGKKAMDLCDNMGIPYISPAYDRCTLGYEELCDFYRKNKIQFYSEEGDVVYLGNGYTGLHSKTGGIKKLYIPNGFEVSEIVFGTNGFKREMDFIYFELKANATALFKLK